MILAAWAGLWCRRGSWCSSPPPRRRDARGRTPPPGPCASWPPPHAAWPTPGFVVESCAYTIYGLIVSALIYLSFQAALRIHEIFVWIRIRISIPLTNGSRSGSGSSLQDVNKKLFCFLLITFWMYIYIIFQRQKFIEMSQNSNGWVLQEKAARTTRVIISFWRHGIGKMKYGLSLKLWTILNTPSSVKECLNCDTQLHNQNMNR